MTYYCPNCWKEIEKDQKACPQCHSEQDELSRETFVQKLIRALHHPEPETPVRAAYILGELRAEEAVQALVDVLRFGPEPYLAAACASALGKIGGSMADKALRDARTSDQSVIARQAIDSALKH